MSKFGEYELGKLKVKLALNYIVHIMFRSQQISYLCIITSVQRWRPYNWQKLFFGDLI